VANSYGISASGNGYLLINESIFNALTPEKKINLMTFELGKVYWFKQTDASGIAPPAILNLVNQTSILGEMGDTKYEGMSLTDLTSDSSADGPSALGMLFRATLLNLQPADRSEAKAWNTLRKNLLKRMLEKTTPARRLIHHDRRRPRCV
jgi:hypothetical protein